MSLQDLIILQEKCEELESKIDKVKRLIADYGGIDGGHHKQWVLDQIMRNVVNDYDEWVKEYCQGEDGANTYEWDVGIAP